MFGIESFQPTFCTSPDELISLTGEKLRLIIGQPVTRNWVLWNSQFDQWWCEWPVILATQDRQLEICVLNDDQLAVSWDSIDLSKPLFPNSDGAGDHLFWKEDALPELANVKGQSIRELRIIEYRPQRTVLKDRQNSALVGKTISPSWLLNGLEFQFDRSCLSIWNALSGIGIDSSPLSGSDVRKTLL